MATEASHKQTQVTERKRKRPEKSEDTDAQAQLPFTKKKVTKSKAKQRQQPKPRKVEVAQAPQQKKRKGKQRQRHAQEQQQAQHQQEPQKPKSSNSTTTNTTHTTAVMEQLESDDYFEVLGLARSATEGDVKKAYRRLAVLWHPDKNRTHPKAEEYFKKIGEAYAVLIDAEQRKVYERYGKGGLGGNGGGGASPSGAGDDPFFSDHFGFGVGGRHGRHAGFSARHARDIFEAFFGGMDPFEELFQDGPNGGGRRRQSRNRNANEWDPMGFGGSMGFSGMGGGMGMGMRGGGLGGMMMMDSFFGGGGTEMNMGGFVDFGSFSGGGSSFSSSSSSSTFTDRNGHVVTKKTTTTVDANGRSETVTEEFRNGKLVSSTSSSTNRLADAGRMQMQLEGNGGNSVRDSASSAAGAATAPPRRLSSSSSRKRF